MGRLKITELRKLCETKGQLDMLETLRYSSINDRVTRKELVDLLHLSERDVRRTISEMRALGIPIASDNHTSGYYIPKTWEQFVAFGSAYTGRAYTTIKIFNKMLTSAEAMFNGQITMMISVDDIKK